MFKKVKKQKTLCFSSADINLFSMLLLYRFAMLLQTNYRIFKLGISLMLLFMIFIATQISSYLTFPTILFYRNYLILRTWCTFYNFPESISFLIQYGIICISKCFLMMCVILLHIITHYLRLRSVYEDTVIENLNLWI